MSVKSYRKKTYGAEGIQYNGDNVQEIIDWVMNYADGTTVNVDEVSEMLTLTIHSDDVDVEYELNLSDYILKHRNMPTYVCMGEKILERLYEEVV